jgi:hypothetical protein
VAGSNPGTSFRNAGIAVAAVERAVDHFLGRFAAFRMMLVMKDQNG